MSAGEADYVDALRRAEALRAEGQFEQAVAAFARAADIARDATPPSASREVRALQRCIESAQFLERLEVIAPALERILALQTAAGAHVDIIHTLLDLARVQVMLDETSRALGQMDRIRTEIEAAGAVLTEKQVRAHRIELELLSAGAFRQRRQFVEAFEHAHLALRLMSPGAEPSVERGDALNELGCIHVEVADPDRAREVLSAALEQYATSPFQAAAVRGNLGIASYEAGDLDAALSYLAQAREFYEGAGYAPGAGLARLQEAVVLLRSGRPAQALEGLTRARHSLSSDPLAGAYLNLYSARAHLALGQVEVAGGEYDEARAAGEALGDRHLEAEATAGLAEIALRRGDAKDAVTHALRGLDLLDGMVARLSPASGAGARHARRRVYDAAIRAAAASSSGAEAFTIFERCRAASLLQMLGADRALEALGVPEEAVEGERTTREALRQADLAYARAVGSRDMKEARAALSLRNQAAHAHSDASQRIQGLARARTPLALPEGVGIDTVSADLAGDERLVLYAVTDLECYGMILGPGEAPRIVKLGDADALREAVGRLDVPNLVGEPLAKAIARLREVLLDPLGLPASARRVLVSPDGAIGRVPFCLLDETRAFTFVPSGSVYHLLGASRVRRGGRMLAAGVSDYTLYESGRALSVYARGRRLRPLDGVAPELLAIQRKGDKILEGQGATEDAVREALAEAKYWDTVHFACHGIANETRPSESGLALLPGASHDGYLSALEIFGMGIHAALISLSACDSGRASDLRGDGMTGLAGAFLHAGSTRVLASLWKIDDDAAGAFMRRFHDLWRPKTGAAGLTAGESLRQAQAHVRAQKGWEHPKYWAAWVLWGRAD